MRRLDRWWGFHPGQAPAWRPAPSPGSLGVAALAAGCSVGVAVDHRPLSTDAAYRATVEREFGAVTPENSMKWGVVHPEPSTWRWMAADAVVEFAAQRSMPVHGHALVWHEQLPAWVDGSLSSPRLRRAMDDHIGGLVGRYAGRVTSWDVVNEALDDGGGGLRNTVFSAKLGPEFIAAAFTRAHEADPRARLFYNDFGAETWTLKADAQYRLVQGLLDAGIPIHGVGFQMHLSAHDPPSPHQVCASIARFAALGLLVRISEMDVEVRAVDSASLARQALVYGDAIDASLEAGASSVTFWGATDGYSWRRALAPLLFDAQYVAKPAYHTALMAFGRRRRPVV
jgi:endo-1,4-beta-xylanase